MSMPYPPFIEFACVMQIIGIMAFPEAEYSHWAYLT